MGGPSAAIVAEELIMLGARRLLRVGTCGALGDGLALGQLLAAEAALPEDGASRALGATGPLAGRTRSCKLRLQAPAGLIVSADLFYDPDPGRADRWRAAGAVAVEMEAATLFAVAARHGLAAACVLRGLGHRRHARADRRRGAARRRGGDGPRRARGPRLAAERFLAAAFFFAAAGLGFARASSTASRSCSRCTGTGPGVDRV